MRRVWEVGMVAALLVAAVFGVCGGGAEAAAAAAAQQRAPGVVHELNARNFDAAVSSGRWLVEFYAPWCTACRAFAPSYEAIANAIAQSPTGGSVRVARVDGWTYSLLSRRFRVTAFPSFLVFSGGHVYEHVGKRTPSGLLAFALPPPLPLSLSDGAGPSGGGRRTNAPDGGDGRRGGDGDRGAPQKTIAVAAQDDVVAHGVRVDRAFGPMAPHWRAATYMSAVWGDIAAAGRGMSTAQLGGVVVGGGMALSVVIVVGLAVLTAPGVIKHD